MISWERCRPLVCDVMASRGVCVPCPGGSFRSDAIHPAGPFTLGDLVAILPFMDVIVVIECTGAQILEGLENGALLCLPSWCIWEGPQFINQTAILACCDHPIIIHVGVSHYPVMEGRFPQVAGRLLLL